MRVNKTMPLLKTTRARNLRKQFTDAENILWYYLRNRRFHNLKFRRQYSIERYYIDFFCSELNFGIELDGGQHYTLDGKKYDRKRTEYLLNKGVKIVRYTNHEVIQNIKSVLEDLTKKIEEIHSSPYPLLKEERDCCRSKEERGDYRSKEEKDVVATFIKEVE